MLYHGFYVKITPLKNIQRERKDGSISDCNGFQIEIFSNQSEAENFKSQPRVSKQWFVKMKPLAQPKAAKKY